jgi:hypothetical protein
MITGAKERVLWANISIQNFYQQDYPNKHMIIVNHGIDHTERLLWKQDDKIQEFMVSKKGKTLGDLRNISIALVPENALFLTWDDDDYRHPSMISYMVNAMITSNVNYILLKNRLNYNCNTNSLWRSSDSRGNVHLLARKKFYYYQKDVNEDYAIRDISSREKLILDNDPKLYTRFVHGTNASIFVKKNQTGAVLNAGPYVETAIVDTDQDYVNSFIGLYRNVCPIPDIGSTSYFWSFFSSNHTVD